MRLRFWIGLAAVLLIAAGSVTAALVVSADDSADFHTAQRDEAVRAAHQAQSVAGLSIGQLASAAAFFQAENHFSRHEFDIVAKPLLGAGVLSGTAFIEEVHNSERAEFEREHGAPIFEPSPNGPRRARPHPLYFPIVYAVSNLGLAAPLGYDLGADPKRAPFLRRARDLGKPVATPPVKLLIGGIGINVYRPVYRDGAPIATVAQRRAALIGFAAGAFRVSDLATAAISTVPKAVAVQLRINRDTVIGQQGELDDTAAAPIHIADRTWLLVVRDPNRPDVSLPLLLAVVGIALAALLGALILVWSRNERMQELEREAGQDPLTGLKNRRRFEEDLQMAMARARRESTTGALLMLDLDHFKQVNDTHGHPAGDQLIREMADVLRRRGRKSDVLARLGGDEFAVVLPRCSPGEARQAAEAIAEAIRSHEPKGDGVEPLTASVGVAMFGDHPRTSIASVVSEADTAMYAAKDGGRDGVRFFDPVAVRDESGGDAG
ncbi:MAG TPA: diguanylate cyclase [Solirubrobacterales bacterium]|jgi:diguanylate cyclase (GGDEF)-like protein|nr:diguanylate cyclase [Solirubrobacterales bacterium]